MEEKITKRQKLIIIQGPTGAGKTDIALSIAKNFPVEIINADSVQIYRFLDIGTSKPTLEQQKSVPHHLFSIINPDQHFSAAQFKVKARQIISDILSRGNIPLVVGGTGFYIKALTKGLFPAPKGNQIIRALLKKRAKVEGVQSLFKVLKEKDPEAAGHINSNDAFRIIRALEIFYLTGKPISTHQKLHAFHDTPYNTLKIGLTMKRELLYTKIEKRVDTMIAKGFLHEVQKILAMGYSPHSRSLQSIGYKQMIQYLSGEISWDKAILQIKRQTKHLAKRQLTWFRHDKEILWVNLPEGRKDVKHIVKNFLNVI